MTGKSAEEVLFSWRDRLITAHRRMQRGMAALIDQKDHQEAATVLLEADKLMVALIEDAGDFVARSRE